MTVKELITELSKFDENLKVTITDGYECNSYNTKYLDIQPYEEDCKEYLDIGIGGNLE